MRTDDQSNYPENLKLVYKRLDDYHKDFQRVHQRLDETRDLLASIQVAMASVTATCPDCRGKVAEHHRALYGSNGTPGIVSEVTSIKRHRARREKMLAGILSTASAIIAATTAAIVKWFSSD